MKVRHLRAVPSPSEECGGEAPLTWVSILNAITAAQDEIDYALERAERPELIALLRTAKGAIGDCKEAVK